MKTLSQIPDTLPLDTLRLTIGLIFCWMLLPGTANAGPQYIDETGYAASGYDVVAFHDLDQADSSTEQPPAVPGKAAITAVYNDVKWAFSTEENRDKFIASPEKYAPAYDGHCAYGVAQGAKVPGNPNLWRVVDSKLYLNITPGVAATWEKDMQNFITKADKVWEKKETKKPSKKLWTKIKDNKNTYDTLAPL